MAPNGVRERPSSAAVSVAAPAGAAAAQMAATVAASISCFMSVPSLVVGSSPPSDRI
jgi:hypothetical protein